MAERIIFSLIGLFVLVMAGVTIARQPGPADYAREQRLIQERDALAAESLRSFRAHQQLQRVIPEFQPGSKPAAGQRDA